MPHVATAIAAVYLTHPIFAKERTKEVRNEGTGGGEGGEVSQARDH